jgi:hypothetical protein
MARGAAYGQQWDALGVLAGRRTRDSRQATLVSNFWQALHRYLATGDATSVLSFRGKTVTDAKGKGGALLVDLPTLDRLASAGVLSFESIYVRIRTCEMPPQLSPGRAVPRSSPRETPEASA